MNNILLFGQPAGSSHVTWPHQTTVAVSGLSVNPVNHHHPHLLPPPPPPPPPSSSPLPRGKRRRPPQRAKTTRPRTPRHAQAPTRRHKPTRRGRDSHVTPKRRRDDRRQHDRRQHDGDETERVEEAENEQKRGKGGSYKVRPCFFNLFYFI